MTLILTAAAPDAIVMGTDSAIALQLPGAPTQLVYSGLKKLFTWSPMGVGVSICGTFPTHVGKSSFSDWMQGWYNANFGTKGIDPDEMAKLLCTHLDKYIDKQFTSPVALHLAMWVTSVKFLGTKIPVIIEIKRAKDKYSYQGLLGADTIQHIYNYRMDPKNPYVIVTFASGLPNINKGTLATLRDLFSSIVRSPVPAPSPLHLVEYVRTLITTVAHLYAAAGLPNYVSLPVETLYLPSETLYGVSMRF